MYKSCTVIIKLVVVVFLLQPEIPDPCFSY